MSSSTSDRFDHPLAGELHPVAEQLMAGAQRSTRPNAHLLPVGEARRNFDADHIGAGEGDPVAAVRDLQIATRDDETIRGRLYQPRAGMLPLVVYLHGGGWLLGSLESHDAACRALANAASAAVLSVDYRRGPEAKAPTAVHDAVDAVRWALAHSDSLEIDPAGVVLAGDSAGGNLAAAASIELRDAGDSPVRLQVLVYPVTTTDLERGFDPRYEGFVLFRDELQWHQDNYLRSPSDGADALVSPLDADLTGLPPAVVVTAQCDPIGPQGRLYAQALRDADVPVVHREYDGMLHGFFCLPKVFEDGQAAIEFVGEVIRDRSRRTEVGA
jgi:acetyl esterase